MKIRNDIHIVPQHGGWGAEVERESYTRFIRNDRDTAVQEATLLARELGVSLIVHGANGKIEYVTNCAMQGVEALTA